MSVEVFDNLVIKKSNGQGPPPLFDDPQFDPNGGRSNGQAQQSAGNAFLAVMLFIGADVMFFAGLIGAFVVFRFGAESWPPPGQPRLPLGVTAVNTAMLLCSGWTMMQTWRRLTKWNRQHVINSLTVTAVFGSIFLLVQGYEWLRLISFGLTLSSGVFGATFYVLIGCHAVHVLGALIWLLTVAMKLNFKPNHYGPQRYVGIQLVGMYWFLVVALWPILYGLVYLS
jgi:heme/copper-type cytochrome/quinol oxidase subunit 3